MDLVYVRIERIPLAVDEELVSAAIVARLPVATAFAVMLSGMDLPATILSGELALWTVRDAETKTRGVHIPEELRDQIVEATEVIRRHEAGEKIGLGVAAGLILIGKKGHMRTALADGMSRTLAATEAPVVVG